MVWFGLVWFGIVKYYLIWFSMIQYCLVWFGMFWYGMVVWFGLVWVNLVKISNKANSVQIQLNLPVATDLGNKVEFMPPSSNYIAKLRRKKSMYIFLPGIRIPDIFRFFITLILLTPHANRADNFVSDLKLC